VGEVFDIYSHVLDAWSRYMVWVNDINSYL